MRITSAGYVGIGTTTPAYSLELVDDQSVFLTSFENTNTGIGADVLRLKVQAATPDISAYFLGCYTGSGLRGGIRNDGAGGVAFTNASDRRLKENIQDLSINGLKTIMQIRPRKYNFIGARESKIGFIAQEMKEVFPQAVIGDEKGDPKEAPMMISYNELIPLLIKGFQEQQNIIEDQKAEIESLKEKLSTLISASGSSETQYNELKNEIAEIKRMLNAEAKASK
jgi:hypothetical protein